MRAPLALVLVAGCSSGARVVIEAPAEWGSALVAVGLGADLGIHAVEAPDALRASVPEGVDVEVIAAFYRGKLADLALVAGPVEPGDRLPPPPDLGGIYRSVIDGSLTDPELLAASDPRLARIRLPALDPARCALIGRCLEIRGAALACVDTCTIPVVADPAPPAPPAPPRFTPCPPRWTEVADRCEPPELAARLACGPGEAQHAGTSSCATIGRACPPGIWPVDLPPGPTVFVDPGLVPGPAGEASVATLADALRIAPAGTVVALSRGAHAGGVRLSGQIVIGACAKDTIITGVAGRITVTSDAGHLEDLTVRGPESADYAIGVFGGALTLAGVIIEHRPFSFDGAIEGHDLLLRDIGGVFPFGPARALWSNGGRSSFRRVVVEHRGDQAILAEHSALELTDLVVTATTPSALIAADRGHITVARAELHGPVIHVFDGGEMDASDLTLAAGPTELRDQAIELTGRSRFTGARIAIDRPLRRAIDVEESAFSLTDGWIRDTGLLDDTRDSLVQAETTSTITLSRTTITGFESLGLEISSGARGHLEDVRMEDPRATGIDDPAVALVQDGSRLAATRLWLAGASGFGLRVVSAIATFDDLTMRGVSGDALVALHGLLIDGPDCTVTIRRADLAGTDSGLTAWNHARLALEDVTIRGVGEELGGGVNAGDGAIVTGQRLDLAACSFALNASDSSMEVSDVRIQNTQHGMVALRGTSRITNAEVLDVRPIGLEPRIDGTIIADHVHVARAFPEANSLDSKGFGALVVSRGALRLSHAVIESCDDAAVGILTRTDIMGIGPPELALTDVVLARSPVGIAQMLMAETAVIALDGVRMIEIR